MTKVLSILESFIEKPSRATLSFERLIKKHECTREEIEEAKKLFKERKSPTPVVKAGIEKKDVEKSISRNLKTGEIQAEIKSIVDITTPEELFAELELDADKWECSQFWSIYKNGRWNISALIKSKVKYDPRKEYESLEINRDKSIEPVTSFSDETLLVYLSDRHIGAMTKANSLMDNPYNAEIYAQRMQETLEEVIRLDKIYDFANIIVVDTGDTLDGYSGKTTRGEHLLPQNMNNREVFTTFMETELFFMRELDRLSYANIIRYTIGDSNHGGDFEWMCHKALEYALTQELPDVKIITGNKFIEHFFVEDHCFMICHGKDSEDMKRPLPKHLDEKTELWIKSYMEHNKISAKHCHFIKGDTHVLNSELGKFFRYKNVPSLYGASKWVQTNFMVNMKGVAFDIISKNRLSEHTLFFN